MNIGNEKIVRNTCAYCNGKINYRLATVVTGDTIMQPFATGVHVHLKK